MCRRVAAGSAPSAEDAASALHSRSAEWLEDTVLLASALLPRLPPDSLAGLNAESTAIRAAIDRFRSTDCLVAPPPQPLSSAGASAGGEGAASEGDAAVTAAAPATAPAPVTTSTSSTVGGSGSASRGAMDTSPPTPSASATVDASAAMDTLTSSAHGACVRLTSAQLPGEGGGGLGETSLTCIKFLISRVVGCGLE